jgi:hypothetical protein
VVVVTPRASWRFGADWPATFSPSALLVLTCASTREDALPIARLITTAVTIPVAM